MAVKVTYEKELRQLVDYLKSEESEDAKRPLIFPLFQKLFKDKFRSESSANGADVYIEGKIIVECKTNYSQWLDGFFQAMHYHKKHGLAYSIIIVIAHKFVGIWRVNKLPEFVVKLAHLSDANLAPSSIGRENARQTSVTKKKQIQDCSIYWLEPMDLAGDYFKGEAKSITIEVHEILNILKNTDAERLQINTRNFIEHIELLKRYFGQPIDAVHCFYSIVAYWDITSVVSTNDRGEEIRIIGFKGQKYSEQIDIRPSHFRDFKKFVESRYIFTNEGSGLTVDYYFSRFDEVMARIDPEYVKQHGIFFTDINLSKFALWFAKEKLGIQLDERYVWFDPAGGSGNLISSWRGNLKHKIISELQPDLLKIIERRMKVDPWHVEKGFTIIPKTSENLGLNFLDCGAKEYLEQLERELKLKNINIDKPLAFLLNPPYKNTDENKQVRDSADSNYQIHENILKLTGEDAGKERYLAFLGQILNIAEYQVQRNKEFEPIVLIFTPTSWLIPRPTYETFRLIWDSHFEYLDGFIITSNEFFKLKGKWPLAFTLWRYNFKNNRKNQIRLFDYTTLSRSSLDLNWSLQDNELAFNLNELIKNKGRILFDDSKGDIRSGLPELERKTGKLLKQPRYDYSTAKKSEERGSLISGFPLKDRIRHFELDRKCGNPNGEFVGFYDDLTPVRIGQDNFLRMSDKPDRVWFRLDNVFINVNQTKCLNGAPDKYGFCAFDLPTARMTFSWFSLTKMVNGRYPIWANQLNIWPIEIKSEFGGYWHALCFAFVLSENRCVVMKFEKDNPVQGVPEIFVDNPLCPANQESFWSQTMDHHVKEEHVAAFLLVNKIKQLYRTWNLKYCKGEFIVDGALQNEPYFKYFDYTAFLTPYSGLIQIRKYAEMNALEDINNLFKEISDLTKKVRDEIYWLLVEEFKYFE